MHICVRQVSVERHLVNDALAYSPLIGNNTGVCSLIIFYFGNLILKAHAIYLVFADLVFSGVKSLSRIYSIYNLLRCKFFYA